MVQEVVDHEGGGLDVELVQTHHQFFHFLVRRAGRGNILWTTPLFRKEQEELLSTSGSATHSAHTVS